MVYFCFGNLLKIKTMKLKNFLLAFFLLACGVSAGAQQHPLMGVWQQQTIDHNGPEGGKLINLPVWKVISGDGTFATFMLTNHEMYSAKYQEGTYRILSDSTYAEQIDRHLVNRSLDGVLNVLTFKFLTENELTVSYRLPGAESASVEIWRRVEMEMPQQHKKGSGKRPEKKVFTGPDADDLEE